LVAAVRPRYDIPSNNKPFSRLTVFKILQDWLGKGIDTTPRSLDPKVLEAASELFDLPDLAVLEKEANKNGKRIKLKKK
jgi:hypothetical protein